MREWLQHLKVQLGATTTYVDPGRKGSNGNGRNGGSNNRGGNGKHGNERRWFKVVKNRRAFHFRLDDSGSDSDSTVENAAQELGRVLSVEVSKEASSSSSDSSDDQADGVYVARQEKGKSKGKRDHQRSTDRPPRKAFKLLGKQGKVQYPNTSNQSSSTKAVAVTHEPNKSADKKSSDRRTRKSCPCNDNHRWVGDCQKFMKMSPVDRRVFVGQNGLCYVCCKSGHTAANCRFKRKPCNKCNASHHSLLHNPNKDANARMYHVGTSLEGIEDPFEDHVAYDSDAEDEGEHVQLNQAQSLDAIRSITAR